MRQPAVDDVRLLDAAAQAVQARLDLRDHAFVDHPRANQLVAASGIDGLAWTAENTLPVSALLLGNNQVRPTGRSFKALSGGMEWNV